MEQAITWIMEHESDPDLDLPLLLPEVTSQASPVLKLYRNHFMLHGCLRTGK